MPRPRSKRTSWMPVGVYLVRGRYILRRDGSELTLAAADATQQQVLTAYVEATRIAPEVLSLSGLMDAYIAGDKYRTKLAPQTQKDVVKAFRMIRNRPTKAGKLFGDIPADAVTMVTMRLYMDKRGTESETRADRELSYLSMAYSWAAQRGLVKSNPCIGVDRFNPDSRDRYASHEEFNQRFALAGEFGRTDVQAAMMFAWLCRLRPAELVRLRESDIGPRGLLARRAKGSKTQVIDWSQQLRDAIAHARSVPRRVSTPQLLVSVKSGLPMSLRSLQDAWNDLRMIAAERGHAIDWHLHDIKAKGVTDAPGDKHLASGHKTHRMTNVYDRLPGKAPPTQ